MSAAKYQRVLAGFQHGWAKLGNKRFNVVIFTPSSLTITHEWNDAPWDREKDYYIAEVRLPFTDDTENRDNFTLSGSVYVTHSPYEPLVSKLEPDFAKSCELFTKLCHHAGAALPEFIRKRLEGYCPWDCRTGASWWIALLAHLRQFRVRNPYGLYIDEQTIYRTWLDSIRLIEALKLNTDAPEWFDEALPQDPPLSDGPFGLDGFRWKGIERVGLRPVPFRLVNVLWNVKDRTARYGELAKSVWDDGEINLRNDDRLSSARRAANKFFESGPFPFSVKLSPKNDLARLIEAIQTLPAQPKPTTPAKARKSPRSARE